MRPDGEAINSAHSRMRCTPIQLGCVCEMVWRRQRLEINGSDDAVRRLRRRGEGSEGRGVRAVDSRHTQCRARLLVLGGLCLSSQTTPGGGVHPPSHTPPPRSCRLRLHTRTSSASSPLPRLLSLVIKITAQAGGGGARARAAGSGLLRGSAAGRRRGGRACEARFPACAEDPDGGPCGACVDQALRY